MPITSLKSILRTFNRNKGFTILNVVGLAVGLTSCLQQAMKLSQLTTKREVVRETLKNYVAGMKKKELVKLRGKITWEGNLKEMRSI